MATVGDMLDFLPPRPSILDTIYFTVHKNRHSILLGFVGFVLAIDRLYSIPIATTLGLDFLSSLGNELELGLGIMLAITVLVCIGMRLLKPKKDLWLYWIFQFSIFGIVSLVLYFRRYSMGHGTSVMLAMDWAMLTMKSHSYFMVLRGNTHKSIEERAISFEEFFWLPTLVYAPQRDLGPPFNWRRFFSELSACALAMLVVNIIHVRYVIPTINSQQLNLFSKFVLLVLPCDINFHLFAYGFWHCIMNTLAEITRFYDRQFYGDWWNCQSVREYFRKWSLPVHAWLYYHPLKESRSFFSKFNIKGVISISQIAAVVVSALFHEVIQVMTMKRFCTPTMAYAILSIGIAICAEDKGFKWPKNSLVFLNFVGHALFYILIMKGCLVWCPNCKDQLGFLIF